MPFAEQFRDKLEPLTMYAYELEGGTALLDVPEFGGMAGKPVDGVFKNGISKQTRSCVYFNGETVVQQKGVRPSLFLDSNLPPLYGGGLIGLLDIDSAKRESDNLRRLQGILPYTGSVIDLGEIRKGKHGGKCGILERRGKSTTFAPHVRLYNLTSYDILEKLIAKGYSPEDVFRTYGSQLGAAHESGVYPLSMHIGNVDLYGNILDLEGALNSGDVEPFSDWYTKRWPENAKTILEARSLCSALEGRGDSTILMGIGAFFGNLGSPNRNYRSPWEPAPDKRVLAYSSEPPKNPLLKQFLLGYFQSRLGRHVADDYLLLAHDLMDSGRILSEAFTRDTIERISRERPTRYGETWSMQNIDAILAHIHGQSGMHPIGPDMLRIVPPSARGGVSELYTRPGEFYNDIQTPPYERLINHLSAYV